MLLQEGGGFVYRPGRAGRHWRPCVCVPIFNQSWHKEKSILKPCSLLAPKPQASLIKANRDQ